MKNDEKRKKVWINYTSDSSKQAGKKKKKT